MGSNLKLAYARTLSKPDTIPRLKSWENLVREYSQRTLSFPSDRIPTLSGLASDMLLPGEGRYFAGLWELSPPQALLWITVVEINERSWAGRAPERYQAPSWSWASTNAAVGMWYSRPDDDVEYVCRVLHAHCTLASTDRFRQVLDGEMRRAGETKAGLLTYSWSESSEMGFYYVVLGGGIERLRLDVYLPFDQNTGQSLHQTPVLVLVVVHRDVPGQLDRKNSTFWGVLRQAGIGWGLRCESRVGESGVGTEESVLVGTWLS